MKPRMVALVALFLAGGVLAGGCTTRGDGGGQGAAGGTSSSSERGAGRLVARPGAHGRQASLTLAPRDRSVIHTATLVVRVADTDKATREATSIVADADGYIAQEHTTTDPDDRDGTTARLTLKIPADRYPGVLHRLSTDLGTQLSLQRRARDVTEKVADVDSRVRSAHATLSRLRSLLDRADTVGQVLKVEREISKREADLEALEARQKALDAKTSYATITLRLNGPPPSTHVERAGFLSGLSAGWAAFRTTVVWLLTAIGAVAPFLLIFGAVVYGCWRAYRFLRRRHPPASAAH
ncbi:MAG: DUF4349 domain-containing protein [Streptosporangiaceae bacterium]